MVKSGQKLLILFTFYFFVYFFKVPSKSGKIDKAKFPSQALAKSAISQN
jgi:hypothetical protein